jgi:molybdenum cofactor cytidylyltransferase
VVALVGGGGKSSTLFQLGRETAARGRRALLTTTTHLGVDEMQAAPLVIQVEGSEAALPYAQLARALDRHGWSLLAGPRQGEKQTGLSGTQVDALAEQAGRLDLALIAVEADGSRKLPLKAPAAHEPVIPHCTTLVVPIAGVDAIGRLVTMGQVHRPAQVAALLGMAEDGALRLTPAQVAHVMLHPDSGDKARPPHARRVALLNKVERPEQGALARLVAAQWVAAGAPGLIAAVGRSGHEPVRERWGALAVVVLAAGQASRMGRAKQLVMVDGISLVRRALQTALAAGAQQVVLVTGAYQAEVAVEVAPLVKRHPHLTIAHNAQWTDGQAGSMQTGLAALAPTTEAVIFLPVDQPFVPSALLRRLVQLWRQGASIAAPSVAGEVRGAPALFDRTLWPELRQITGDVGGRSVLRRYASRVQTFPVEPEWLHDLDTPEDLAR